MVISLCVKQKSVTVEMKDFGELGVSGGKIGETAG